MPETNGNRPATQADLHALENRLIKAIAGSQAEILEHMHEFVRDAQTELLRGFEAYSIGHNVRMRKLQADLSNVDASTDQRLLALENRLLQIEKRLPLTPPEQ
jgi:flagellar biosynthesis/type III secretory pathway protein FliH